MSNATAASIAAIVTIVVSVFAVGAAATSDADSRPDAPTSTLAQPSTPTQPSAATGLAIAISKFAFDPAEASIVNGSTVTWTNDDDVTHNIFTSDGMLASADLERGGTYSATFEEAAVVEYFCDIHQYMRGTVTVTP